ncbi:MAG TPA: cysteine hydrolase family protein [Rhodocyclaceae bacterium]
MITALLVIDVQNDYFPGGNMALERAHEAAANAARLLADFRGRGRPVFHVQHLMARPNAGFLMPGTAGAEIHPAVAPIAGEATVVKHYPNSFRETALLDELRRADARRLVVAGMMTHMCIDATVRAAFDLGFSVVLAHDACATRSLRFGEAAVPAAQVHAAFVAALHGMFAEAKSVEEILRPGTAAP